MHPPIYVTYLNGLDVAELKLTDDEILAAIESSLAAQGRGHTVIEPRMHLVPGKTGDGRDVHGHFNVLRGYVAPLGLAGVKIVGDFVGNVTQHNVEQAQGGTFPGLENYFFPREIELSLFGQIDPYARGEVRIEAEQESRGGELGLSLA